MNRKDKHIIDQLQVHSIQLPSDSYFEELKKKLLQEVGNEGLKEKEAPRIISMYKRWYVWGSAAAILAFCFFFPWNTTDSPSKSDMTVSLSSVSSEEIYQYLHEHIEDLDAETIAVHLSKDAMAYSEWNETASPASTENGSKTVHQKSQLLDHIDDEEILDYLKDDPDTYRDGELDEYLLIES